ncbi:hypothetical protein [Endozoicomonas sp. Mp262]|uniref:H-NS family histone-like protein n=1 Tax=Endozoicomonas sp. Mp262 TaxID=2919499 RepID=UPI0021D91B60
MNNVLQEKLEQKEIEKQQRLAKVEIITSLKKTLQDNGLSLSDLPGFDSEKSMISLRKTTKEKYTFQYISLSGDTVFWYGTTAGRLPKAFQDYLDRTGKKRMDCIVNNV